MSVYLLDPELEGVRLSDGWPSGLLAFPLAATTVESSEVNVNREVLFTKEKREVINKTLNSERSFDIIWYDFNVLSGKYFSRLYICHVIQTLRDKLSRKQWEITLAYFRYRGFRYPEKPNPSERRKAQKWKCMTLVTAPFSHGAGCQVFPPKQHVKRACFSHQSRDRLRHSF